MRIVASLLAMLGLAATGLASSAASSESQSLLAAGSIDGQQVLFHVDDRTLARIDTRVLQLPRGVGSWLRSPDRMLIAFGSSDKPVLTFADIGELKLRNTLQVGTVGGVDVAAWPRADRLLCFVYDPLGTNLVVVDPLAGRVLARRRAPGAGWPRVALPDGLVYLAAGSNGIRPARLVLVDADGNARSVVLNRIRAGIRWRTVRGVRIGDIREPGLAADTVGRKAYVVSPGELVAEVDLATLDVAYHWLNTDGTRRLAKSINGPMRSARWLGKGRIAVSGTDAKMTVTRTGAARQTWTPAGLSVIDTSTWRSQVIDGAASWFTPARQTMLVAGEQSLTAYDVDGRRHFVVTLDEPSVNVQAVGDYVYAWGRDHTTTIVRISTGEIVSRLPKLDFWLLENES